MKLALLFLSTLLLVLASATESLANVRTLDRHECKDSSSGELLFLTQCKNGACVTLIEDGRDVEKHCTINNLVQKPCSDGFTTTLVRSCE